jgi:hypothetical protein
MNSDGDNMSMVETLAQLLGGSAWQVDTDRSHATSPSPFNTP